MKETEQAQADYQTNIDAKLEIEALTKKLNSIEVDKLDKIIRMLEQIENNLIKMETIIRILNLHDFLQKNTSRAYLSLKIRDK
jgi:uncharacterized membrane protein